MWHQSTQLSRVTGFRAISHLTAAEFLCNQRDSSSLLLVTSSSLLAGANKRFHWDQLLPGAVVLGKTLLRSAETSGLIEVPPYLQCRQRTMPSCSSRCWGGLVLPLLISCLNITQPVNKALFTSIKK